MILKKTYGFIILAILSVGIIGVTEKITEASTGTSQKFWTGENFSSSDRITGVDEEGNVYVLPDDKPEYIIGNSPIVLSEGGQLVNFRTKSSGGEVTEYTDTITGEDGYTNGTYAADGAYLGMEDGKVKFMLSGVIGLVDPSEVTIVQLDEAKSVSYYEVIDGRLIHRITQDMAKNFYGSNLDGGEAPSYLQENVIYHSYDGHYFYTRDNFELMLEDYRNGNRDHAVNKNQPYFNYFQYLPFRSKTNYSADKLKAMIDSRVTSGSKLLNEGQNLVKSQNQYGTNALLVAGIAANESAWGTSSICQIKNNIFGINAVDVSPGESADTFPSVKVCIEEYTQYMLSQQYLNPENWKYAGGFLGDKASGMNVRYASDPYWGEKAAAIARSLDRSNGGHDEGYYTIGIKDILPEATNLRVRTEASTAADVVFTSGNWPCQSFLVLDSQSVSGFFRVQSDGALNGDRNKLSQNGNYNFVNMFLYASADYIDIVISGKVVPISYADTFAVRRGNQYFFKFNLSGGEADETLIYGKVGDEVYVGDWDGDGVDTLCVRRGREYYFKNSIDSGEADRVILYGKPEDTVLVGDWDGDGIDTLCVRRGREYYFKNSIDSGEADHVVLYGKPDDTILTGDWDGDGIDTLCVRRGREYYMINKIQSGEADRIVLYGRPDDIVLIGDWDGDDIDTLCVRRNNIYYLKNSMQAGEADRVFGYGRSEDIVLVGTWLEKPISSN